MGVSCVIEDLDVVQADVQEPEREKWDTLSSLKGRGEARDGLVDRLEGAGDGEIVFELDGDPLVREGLEYGEDELLPCSVE